jgi:hypothetical protein
LRPCVTLFSFVATACASIALKNSIGKVVKCDALSAAGLLLIAGAPDYTLSLLSKPVLVSGSRVKTVWKTSLRSVDQPVYATSRLQKRCRRGREGKLTLAWWKKRLNYWLFFDLVYLDCFLKTNALAHQIKTETLAALSS